MAEYIDGFVFPIARKHLQTYQTRIQIISAPLMVNV